MKTFAIGTMLSVAALTACTVSGQDAVSRLSATPVVSGGAYSTGGGLSVAAEVTESGGKTLVCGVWAQSKKQSVLSKHGETRVLAKGSIELGRETLVRNLLFMQEVEPASDYGGQDAGCLKLDRAWTQADALKTVKIRIPRQVVDFDGGDLAAGGGTIVTFVQTGPEA